jgi:tetratricopeptide (TPR) repeat protein
VPPITITALPPSADALLLDRLELVAHYFKDADPGYPAMIRARAARFPDDQLATLALGQTELELGDPVKGRALLEEWIKAHPDDVEAMFVLGDHLIDQARAERDEDKSGALRDDARALLQRAAQLAPNDYRVLYAYAQARYGEPGFPTVETQALLINAYKRAPQVDGLRFELVQVLIARRHWREAEALLKPLVNSPHGGEVVDKAREMMKRVQAALAAGSG